MKWNEWDIGDRVLAVTIATLLFVLFILVILAAGDSMGYKQGQKDAINDIIKYELREMDDGEMKWKKIKED